MKKLTILFVCAMLIGCEYSVQLTNEPQIAINQEALGLWERELDGKTEHLLLLPLSEKKYLVEFTVDGSSIFGTAIFTNVGKHQLVQIQWVGDSKGNPPNTDQVYQYARYDIEKDTLKVEMINSSTLPGDYESVEAFRKDIVDKWQNPALFRDVRNYARVKNS